MIRIEVDRQQLLDDIAQRKDTWIARAKIRTDQYILDQDYTGGSEFWGEIKGAYIDRQFEKCAYCETKLAGKAFASKVHEVEHYRPKSSVKAWPDPALEYLKDFVPPCPTGSASTKGYFALAYHPFNYVIACTRCNSTLKSNYFPIASQRQVSLVDPSLGDGEQPLLIYPLSDLDTNPASLITFDGVLAQPVMASGPGRARALVTIAFFQLNHEDLTSRRASLLPHLFVALETRRADPASSLGKLADKAIRLACSPRAEFSRCSQAFVDQYDADRTHAEALAMAAAEGGDAG